MIRHRSGFRKRSHLGKLVRQIRGAPPLPPAALIHSAPQAVDTLAVYLPPQAEAFVVKPIDVINDGPARIAIVVCRYECSGLLGRRQLAKVFLKPISPQPIKCALEVASGDVLNEG